MAIDYRTCENCFNIICEGYIINCNFCGKDICHDCMDEKTQDYIFECDINGNIIKPDDYNCILCDNIEQEKTNINRKNEIYDEILKVIKTKKHNKKCKELIEELKNK